VPPGKSVIADAYPPILRRRWPGEGRTADENDAHRVARWLRETCERGVLEHYLRPPLMDEERAAAELEGWILGIA
jgi:hypothetical protein